MRATGPGPHSNRRYAARNIFRSVAQHAMTDDDDAYTRTPQQAVYIAGQVVGWEEGYPERNPHLSWPALRVPRRTTTTTRTAATLMSNQNKKHR